MIISLRAFGFLFFFLILLSPVYKVHAGEWEQKQNNFIIELFRNREYYAAATELRRLLPGKDAVQSGEIHYLIRSCYYLGNQYLSVIDYPVLPERIFFRDLLLESRSFLQLGRSHEALNILSECDYKTLNPHEQYDLLYGRIEPYLIMRDPSSALKELDRVSKYMSGSESLDPLMKELLSYSSFREKSPAMGAFLSAIIPGSGQLYSCRYMDSVISFLSVALTAVGGYSLYSSGSTEAGLTLFFFSGLFYGGNIYSAWNSVNRYNFDNHHRYIKRIEECCIPEYSPANEHDFKRILQ